MSSLEKSGTASQKTHHGGDEHEKSWKFEKLACRFKTAGIRSSNPIFVGKSISMAFQRVSRIALKLPEH